MCIAQEARRGIQLTSVAIEEVHAYLYRWSLMTSRGCRLGTLAAAHGAMVDRLEWSEVHT